MPEQPPTPQIPPAAAQPAQAGEMYFVVPAVALAATVEILQQLPYKQVQHVIPVLTSCQQVSGQPGQPEEK